MEQLKKGHVYVIRMKYLSAYTLDLADDISTYDKQITSEEEYDEVFHIYRGFSETGEGFNRYIEKTAGIVPEEYFYIPVLLKYMGNGEFEELSTGKKMIDFYDDNRYESFKQLPREFKSCEELIELLPVLRKHPLIIHSSEDYYLREVCDIDKIDHQKLPIDEMKKIILEVFDNASKKFQSSLDSFVEKDYAMAKTEDLIRTFSKK